MVFEIGHKSGIDKPTNRRSSLLSTQNNWAKQAKPFRRPIKENKAPVEHRKRMRLTDENTDAPNDDVSGATISSSVAHSAGESPLDSATGRVLEPAAVQSVSRAWLASGSLNVHTAVVKPLAKQLNTTWLSMHGCASSGLNERAAKMMRWKRKKTVRNGLSLLLPTSGQPDGAPLRGNAPSGHGKGKKCREFLDTIAARSDVLDPVPLCVHCGAYRFVHETSAIFSTLFYTGRNHSVRIWGDMMDNEVNGRHLGIESLVVA